VKEEALLRKRPKKSKKSKKAKKAKKRSRRQSTSSSSSASDSENSEADFEKEVKSAMKKQKKAEAEAKNFDGDERKRGYNSNYETKAPTEAELEAYQRLRQREEDPMAKFF